jgi:hypothetical protein
LTKQRLYQLRQVARGRCMICATDGFKGGLCKGHYAEHQNKRKRRLAELVALGQCMQCKGSSDGKQRCLRCREAFNAASRQAYAERRLGASLGPLALPP